MADESGEQERKASMLAPRPPRNKPAEVFSVICIAAGLAFAVYWYVPPELMQLLPRAPEITGSTSSPRLTRQIAGSLVESALAREAVVLRVPLGDVVNGEHAGRASSGLCQAGRCRTHSASVL
jgi:hypothetical protein